ncbi:hypothetical protein ARSEF1564_007799 [Beauveria bassiana]
MPAWSLSSNYFCQRSKFISRIAHAGASKTSWPPLYMQNHPSTGLPGSETGHGCGPVDTGTFGLPLSPTRVTDGRYGYRRLIRLFLFHVESLIVSGMAKLHHPAWKKWYW